MKKDEIMKRLSSFKNEPSSIQQQQQHQQRQYHAYWEERRVEKNLRSSSESDQADNLSVSIATSVLQDDSPSINYAAAVLRGKQAASVVVSFPLQNANISYSNGNSESG